MKESLELSFGTPEEQEELLYYLILAIRNFEETGTLPNTLKEIYRFLSVEKFIRNKEGSKNQKPIINSYYEFLELFETPLNDWFIWNKNLSKDTLSLIKQKPIIFGHLNEVYYEFLNDYKEVKINKLNHQQLSMRSVVEHCREFELENDYNLIRDYIVNSPFILSSEFEDFKLNFISNGKLLNYVDDMYKTFSVQRKTKILLCGYCQMPLKKIGDKYSCLRPDVCEYYEVVKNKKRTPITIYPGQKWYVLKEGVHYYNCLPGIEEVRLFNYLKNKYKNCIVDPYPNLDKDGDVKITYKGHEFFIDLKDYQSPEWLYEKNRKELVTKDFIYIPEHRTYNQHNYVSYLEKKLKNTKTKVGGQKKLIETINKWIGKIEKEGL